MSKMDESKIYVAFLAMIENLDNYKFFKNADGTHAIDVEIKGGIKEQMDTITNRYNKWLYLFHISSC